MNASSLFEVRSMIVSDLDAVIPMCERLHYKHGLSEFNSTWKRTWLQEFLANTSNVALVGWSEKVLGYLLGESRNEEYSNTPFLYIREVYVDEGSRLQGYGQALLRTASQRAVQLGCFYLSLNVRQENPALGFFADSGFKSFSTEMRRPL